MKLGLRQIITLVATLFLARIMPAQDLPKMPDDPAIVKGVFPNGMAYYVVSNAAQKGLADFSLVQRAGRKNVADSSWTSMTAHQRAKDALASLPRLNGQSPRSFFLRHGSASGPQGYVSVKDDATIFRFPDVRIDAGKTVLDSALVVLMDIADRATFSDDSLMRHWYSPADQAIVIAGDIDAAVVAMKLESMSYMMPALPAAEYNLPEAPVRTGLFSVSEGELKKISVSWASKRVPVQYMNTVQPIIFDMSLDILGRIAVKRIRDRFRTERIPVAEVAYSHINSSSYPYDDVFSVSAVVLRDDDSRACELISDIMSSIGFHGVGYEEYLIAESAFMMELKRISEMPLSTNEAYIERCITSFLYNSMLSSPKQTLAFHTSRDIPDTTRCRLFNGVASALISAPVQGNDVDSVTVDNDLVLPGAGPKVRIRSTRKDPISGGLVWTFSNGIKVVYKKMPADNDVYFSLALSGGYASIKGLSEGEGAFASDVFHINKIAGIRGDEFMSRLKKDGLLIEPKITMSNTLIEGRVTNNDIPLLLRGLLAFANEGSINEEDFPYYRQCEDISLEYSRNSRSSRIAAIDSIMCPGYRFSPYKSKGALTSSFLSDITSFVESQMQKVNDGVLVIVGDLDEEYLKQQLLTYVGNFKTADIGSRRAVIRYQPKSGTSTYVLKGRTESVDVVVSARMPLTSDNYYSASIAMMLLEQELARGFAQTGMSSSLSYNCRIYPEERINVMISVMASDNDGFVADEDILDALNIVRRTLSGLCTMEISEADLQHFKAYQKNLISLQIKDPVYWIDAIAVRYLDGKDLTTGYASKLDDINADKVRNIFVFMGKGCQVEYVTQGL